MSKYILGIDGGTQSTKLVLFDLAGKIINETKVTLEPTVSPEPGEVEYQGDNLWTSLVEASNELLKQFKGKKEEIIAVGLGSIRFCRVLLDQNGELAQPVIHWMDKRVGKPFLRENSKVKYIATTTGYLGAKMTGAFNDAVANYIDTMGNHEGSWPIDIDRWCWRDEEEIAKFNVSKDMLFDLAMPGELIGNLTANAAKETGLPEGIPIVATANDKAVEGLGAGLKDKNVLVLSLGTYITSMVVGDTFIRDTKNFWTNFSSEPNKFLYESNGIWRGMSTVSWFKELLGEPFCEYAQNRGLTPEDILNKEAAMVVPGAEGLTAILDWLSPEGKPDQSGGMLFGIARNHKRAHVYRAILEGIVLTMKKNAEAMLNELGRDIDEIIVTGGGSNSDLILQMVADVFDKPVSRNTVNEAASLGAAICAAVYTQEYQNFDDAIDHMVSLEDDFQPNAADVNLYKEIYNQRYIPE